MLDCIQNFPGKVTVGRGRRRFVPSTSQVDEPPVAAFSTSHPDFSLLGLGVDPNWNNWRDRDGFYGVKATKEQGPKRQGMKTSTIPDVVSQAGDYARFHLSAKPFVLFSVGLLIHGSHFCVAIFDRDGVCISPVGDIWQETRYFIRVVRSMTCELTGVELGLDPTVTELDLHATRKLLGPSATEPTYPSYIIDSVGNNAQRWCTVGPPIWSSISLLGRGTMVWHVRRYNANQLHGPVMVLKTAWRSSKRDPESSIYEAISGRHPGLANYLIGGDVFDPRRVLPVRDASHHDKTVISVCSLRGNPPHDGAATSILHRLIMRSVGKPLWEYKSDLELLRGMVAALQGPSAIRSHPESRCAHHFS